MVPDGRISTVLIAADWLRRRDDAAAVFFFGATTAVGRMSQSVCAAERFRTREVFLTVVDRLLRVG
jgi:hypothetical protein